MVAHPEPVEPPEPPGPAASDASAGTAGTIRTARLDLLPLRVEHAEEMAQVLGDPALHAFIGGVPDTPAALRARYARLVAGSPDPGVRWLNWVLRRRADACLVGTVQATVTGEVAEIAWVVGTPWQGRGFASEAARGLVARLTRQSGSVRTVVAHVHPDHHASASVAAAAGLSPTDREQDGETRWELTVRARPDTKG
ncbi:GNAT family N-acetyltransferase [Streptomyces avermitilis]|uniref:GNAT family N-acetyltransferase n=1 Tax=Streptomyces avermitilis TaxID=33903 RepID=UPI003404A73A